MAMMSGKAPRKPGPGSTMREINEYVKYEVARRTQKPKSSNLEKMKTVEKFKTAPKGKSTSMMDSAMKRAAARAGGAEGPKRSVAKKSSKPKPKLS